MKMSDKRIVLKVSPEVSELDMHANALTIQGFNVPAFRRRSTTTTASWAAARASCSPA